jgi:hypothetical protein
MNSDKREMHTYVVEMWHEVLASPLGNSKVHEFVHNVLRKRSPQLMKELGIRQIGDYHLDPEHRAIMVYRAPSVETLRDFLYRSGFCAYVNSRIYPSRPLSELAKWIETEPPMF